jgi:dihydroflavonol-4-reductase
MTFDDAQKDLVDPAVKGTTNVLHTCARTPDLRRVVLTSSVAAITDSPKPEHTYTEADWNEESSLDRNPYYYSKAMAERAAWDFVEKLKDDAEAVRFV